MALDDVVETGENAVQAGLEQGQNFLNTLMGGGGTPNPRTDVRMGMGLLALVNQNSQEIGPGGEMTRQEGAGALYDRLETTVTASLTTRRENAGDTTPLTAEDIQTEMIARMEAELVSLSHGKPLTANTSAQVAALFGQSRSEFLDDIAENAAELNSARQQHLERVEAANRHNQDNPNDKKPIPLYEHIGIMDALTKPDIEIDENGNEKVVRESVLGNVNVNDVDVSPQAQLRGAMDNAFDSMSKVMFTGKGAETYLAQIHGETWGEFKSGLSNDADRGTFAGLNTFRGPGTQRYEPLEGSPYKEWVDKFTSDAGLGGEHAVVTGGEGVTANAHNLFTQPLIDQGLLVLDGTPEEQQVALTEWNDGLRGGLLKRLGGEDLQEHMQQVAQGIPGLTLGDGVALEGGEPVVHYDGLDRAREIVAQQEADGVDMRVGSDDWTERRAEVLAQEAEAESARQVALAEAAAAEAQAARENEQAQVDNNGLDNVELSSADIGIDASQALMRQFDSAGLQVQRDTFVPDAGTAARLGLDNVDSQLGTVPVVVAGLNNQPTQPQPIPGVGQVTPGVNSTIEPQQNLSA